MCSRGGIWADDDDFQKCLTWKYSSAFVRDFICMNVLGSSKEIQSQN